MIAKICLKKQFFIILRAYHTLRNPDTKGSTYKEWVPANQVRDFKFTHCQPGTRVQVKGAASGKWFAATLLGAWESLHYCKFDGYSPNYNEWVGPSRIKSMP